MTRIRPSHTRTYLALSLIIAAIGVVPAAAQAASRMRIMRPANDALVNGRRMVVVVSVPDGARQFRVSLDGSDVTSRFRARGLTRVGTLTQVGRGGAHLVVTARVRSRQLFTFARVYARGRRAPSMISLLNANATLVRRAENEGVARLAIRTPSDAILQAKLNGHDVDVPVDFGTGNRLAVFNRGDGLRRGRNTLHLLAFTHDGRYDTLTRSATIPSWAPMAAAGRDRRIVAGQTLRLDGGGSVPGVGARGLRYRWRVVAKPRGTSPRLQRAASAKAKLRLRQPGRYTLAVTATQRQRHGKLHRSTDLLRATVAPSAPPTGARIDTMKQTDGHAGVEIDTSPAHFYAAPPTGSIGVWGFDPKTLRSDPDLNSVIPDSGDVDSAIKNAVSKFTASTIVVVTASDCCSASSKLLPRSGAFSYITVYDGDKDHFGQSGTWNRNLALTDDQGNTLAKGELTGVLRFQPSADGGFRYIQDGRLSFSTNVPTESTLAPADGATYRILDTDGSAVDVAGNADSNGPLHASTPSSALSQQWELQRAYGDYYRIVNAGSGLCMNLSGNDAKTVFQWSCTGSNAPNELWLVRDGSDGNQHFYWLEPASQPPGAATPVVATIAAAGITVAPLSDSDAAQRFTFGPAPGVYTISDASTGKLISEPDFTAANGTQLKMSDASGHSTQQWRLVDGPQGTFKLVNVASALCMDVTGGSTDAGTPIERYACDPNATNQPNELWSAVRQADGLALVSKRSGMALSRQGDGLVQHDDNDDKGQRWVLNRVTAPVTTRGSYAIEAVSATGWDERRALDAAGGAPTLTAMSDAGSQQWQLTDAGHGLVELYSRDVGKCLTPSTTGTVSLSACDSDSGVWRVDRRADGTNALTNTGPGGGVLTAGSGTDLSVTADHGDASQDWMLGGLPVTMDVGGQRAGTAVPFGAAGFVVTAFDASGKSITGPLTGDDGETIPAPTWPASYVTNGTRVSDGESLGLLLQGLAKQAGTTVLIQSVGRPKPGPGWEAIASAIKELGGDAAVFRQLDGSGDYALVGCAGCKQATEFDEAARRASDPNLVGARLQGSLAHNENSTFTADAGSAVPIDSSLGELVGRPSSPWPFATTESEALSYIATQLNLTETCNDQADLDPVRDSYCLQNVDTSTPWPDRAQRLDKLAVPDGVDADTWAQIKTELHTEWTDLDNVHRTLQSLSTVYSSVASGSAAKTASASIAQLIQDDLHQPPPPRDVAGDVLSVISDALQLVGSTGLVEGAAPQAIQPGQPGSNLGANSEPDANSTAQATLGLLSEAWSLAGRNDGDTDAAGNTIETTATNFATDLDQELSNIADDLPVVENALVSDPVRLDIAGNNADQDWTLPEDSYADLKGDLKAGLTRTMWTELLPAAYDVYQFPRLPSGVALQSMACNGHKTFDGQPDAAVWSMPTSFDAAGSLSSSVTMTLSPKTAQGGDDLQYPRHLTSALTNALFGTPAAGSVNAGFSTRELIGQTGIDTRDQTAKQPAGNTPIFPCFVYNQNNSHSWDYNQKTKNWEQVR